MWTKRYELIWLVIFCAVLAILWMVWPARSQHGHHGHGHDVLHDWYRKLMRPDFLSSSCCNEQDCRPTESRWNGTHWEAKKDGWWIIVPPEKVIYKDPSIDTQAHLCAPSAYSRSYGQDYIFCFAPGGGI